MNSSLLSLLGYLEKNSQEFSGFAVDVGGHRGDYSRFLLGVGCFDKVYAFEPLPENFIVLREIGGEGARGFVPVPKALGATKGSLNINYDEDLATASLLQYEKDYQSLGVRKTKLVEVDTLDDFLRDNSTGKLAFIKIDTQGNDLAVICGGKGIISRDRPIIQTEFIFTKMYDGQCSPNELINFLSGFGYLLYSVNNVHVSPQGRLAFCDALFIPKELDVPEDGPFRCIDDEVSFKEQLANLAQVCDERLELINRLDSELQHIKSSKVKFNFFVDFFKRAFKWGR